MRLRFNRSCSKADLQDALARGDVFGSGVTVVAADALPAEAGSLTFAIGTLRSDLTRTAVLSCPTGRKPGAPEKEEETVPRCFACSAPGQPGQLSALSAESPSGASSEARSCPVVFHLNSGASALLAAASRAGGRSAPAGAAGPAGDAGAGGPATGAGGDTAPESAAGLIPGPLSAIAELLNAGDCPVSLLEMETPVLSLGAMDGCAHAVDPSPAGTGLMVQTPPPGSVHARAQARVGLMGNPSDGYNGKSVSLTLENFWVDVWAWPSATTRILLHPLYDPIEFRSPEELVAISKREGYSGGTRLLMAAIYRFYRQCQEHGVKLRGDTGVTLKYHTNVPRQVGLAGSSAIITAILRALAAFHRIDTDERLASAGLSKPKMPGFVLAIESEELGISAGLQDRVVQWYEGLVHMDFNKDAIDSLGHGTYTNLSIGVLPQLFLAYAPDPSDSGRIHMPIRKRWLDGDKEVVDAMQDIASNCDATRELLAEAEAKSTPKSVVARKLGALVRRNFKGRLDLFTAPALGDVNLQMIGIGEGLGAAAKFPGSGGAVVGVVDAIGMAAMGSIDWAEGAALANADLASVTKEVVGYAEASDRALDALRVAYQAKGFVFVPIVPHGPTAGGGMGPVEIV